MNNQPTKLPPLDVTQEDRAQTHKLVEAGVNLDWSDVADKLFSATRQLTASLEREEKLKDLFDSLIMANNSLEDSYKRLEHRAESAEAKHAALQVAARDYLDARTLSGQSDRGDSLRGLLEE